MITYQKTVAPKQDGVDKKDLRYLYKRNGLLCRYERIPHEVQEKFEYATEVEYDDKPDKRRCVFCDAPQSRIRYLNQQTVDLCEWHYQNMSLGKIAQQLSYLAQCKAEKEANKENHHGTTAKASKRGKSKGKESDPAKTSKLRNYA